MTAALDHDWRVRAACRGHDPEMWSLSAGRGGVEYREAHRICAGCPVREPCGEFGEASGSWGMIFGGRDFYMPKRAATPQETYCERCGMRFLRTKAWTRFCSERCRKANYVGRR